MCSQQNSPCGLLFALLFDLLLNKCISGQQVQLAHWQVPFASCACNRSNVKLEIVDCAQCAANNFNKSVLGSVLH